MAYITPSKSPFLSMHTLHQNSISSFQTFWTHEQDTPEASLHSRVLYPSESPLFPSHSAHQQHFPGTLPCWTWGCAPEELGSHSPQLPELTHPSPSTKPFTSYSRWKYFIFTVLKFYILQCTPPTDPRRQQQLSLTHQSAANSHCTLIMLGNLNTMGKTNPSSTKTRSCSSAESHIADNDLRWNVSISTHSYLGSCESRAHLSPHVSKWF